MKGCNNISLELSPGWTAPALLACLQRKNAAALWSSSWPSSEVVSTCPCLLAVLRALELEAALQIGPCKSREEGQSHLSQSAGHVELGGKKLLCLLEKSIQKRDYWPLNSARTPLLESRKFDISQLLFLHWVHVLLILKKSLQYIGQMKRWYKMSFLEASLIFMSKISKNCNEGIWVFFDFSQRLQGAQNTSIENIGRKFYYLHSPVSAESKKQKLVWIKRGASTEIKYIVYRLNEHLT